MAVGEHLADRVVGLEQRLVADVLRPQHRELARIGELGVIRIDFEPGRRRHDARLLAQRLVAPVVLGRQLEGRLDQVVAFGVVLLQLLARADRGVVPVVDAVAVEVGLADFGPVFGLVGCGVGVLPQPLVDGVAIGLAAGACARPGSIRLSAASMVWQNSWTAMLSSS